MTDGLIYPEFPDSAPVSTPLHRAAQGLQSVLPAGWQVEVVDAGDGSQDGQPIVRASVVTD